MGYVKANITHIEICELYFSAINIILFFADATFGVCQTVRLGKSILKIDLCL